MNNKLKIPGWKQITPSNVNECPGVQNVNGQLYAPAFGSYSLQKVVDEWLEYVAMLWHETSYVSSGIRSNMCTRTSEDAEGILREWGMLDENGEVRDDDGE